MANQISIDPFDRRCTVRTIIDEYYTIEFVIADDKVVNRFKIKNVSPYGLCFMANMDDRLFDLLKAGDVIDIKYYPTEAKKPVKPARVKIIHITEDSGGQFEGVKLVGLSLLQDQSGDSLCKQAVKKALDSQ